VDSEDKHPSAVWTSSATGPSGCPVSVDAVVGALLAVLDEGGDDLQRARVAATIPERGRRDDS